jgi:hypothetical protein
LLFLAPIHHTIAAFNRDKPAPAGESGDSGTVRISLLVIGIELPK